MRRQPNRRWPPVYDPHLVITHVADHVVSFRNERFAVLVEGHGGEAADDARVSAFVADPEKIAEGASETSGGAAPHHVQGIGSAAQCGCWRSRRAGWDSSDEIESRHDEQYSNSSASKSQEIPWHRRQPSARAKTTESMVHQDQIHCRMDRSVERSIVKRLWQVVLDAIAHLSTRLEQLRPNDLRPVDRRPDYRQQSSSAHQRDETQIRCRRHRTRRIRLRATLGHLDTRANPPTKKRPQWDRPQISSPRALSMAC